MSKSRFLAKMIHELYTHIIGIIGMSVLLTTAWFDKELVKLMGDHIGLESEEGKGTMAWFELPFERQPDVRKEELAPSSIHELRVLVLLNDAVVPEVGKALERWGVEFEAATGTAQLFSHLVVASEQSRPFRTVIVDRDLLSMDAAQFAESLKKETTLANVSLILIDSRLEPVNTKSLIMTGYSAVLYKPINESLLFNAVHEACAEHLISPGVASMADYFTKREAARSSRVLVAEDNEVNQTVLRAILERAGHQVHMVSDGEEALDILTERDTDFDIVILDINMPKISGLDVLKTYRFMETGMNMPVIMLSAYALPRTIDECKHAGADDYLTKPVNAKRLVEAIDKLSRPAKVHDYACDPQIFMLPSAAGRIHDVIHPG